jgi:hypothetical protein
VRLTIRNAFRPTPKGLGDPADPGADRRRPLRCHPLPAAIGQGHAHARADRDDRERFRPPPQGSPLARPYLHELTAFPKGRHDDQVDSTAQTLDWFKRGSGPSSNAGIFELYRQRAAEARRQQAAGKRRVRLRVPQGIGRMNMLHLNVAADGTVEMLESEAESFLRAGWVRWAMIRNDGRSTSNLILAVFA